MINPNTKFYKILTKGGHFGKDYRELLFYVCGKDIFEAMNRAKHMAGVKHDATDCIIKCTEISREEYIAQKVSGRSAYDTYRQYDEREITK